MSIQEEDLNAHIIKMKIKTEIIFAIADSGTPMSFLNEKAALRSKPNENSAMFKYNAPEDAARNLACNNDTKSRKEDLSWQ